MLRWIFDHLYDDSNVPAVTAERQRQWGRDGRERDGAGYFYWAKSVHLCLTSTHITAPTEHTERETEMSLSITESQSSQWNLTTGVQFHFQCPHFRQKHPCHIVVCSHGKYIWHKLSGLVKGRFSAQSESHVYTAELKKSFWVGREWTEPRLTLV